MSRLLRVLDSRECRRRWRTPTSVVRLGEEANLVAVRHGRAPSTGAEQASVVVELDHGPAFGRVEQSPMPVFKPCQKSSRRGGSCAEASDRGRPGVTTGSCRRETGRRSATCANARAQLEPGDEGLEGRVRRSMASRASVYFTADRRVDFRQARARHLGNAVLAAKVRRWCQLGRPGRGEGSSAASASAAARSAARAG